MLPYVGNQVSISPEGLKLQDEQEGAGCAANKHAAAKGAREQPVTRRANTVASGRHFSTCVRALAKFATLMCKFFALV